MSLARTVKTAVVLMLLFLCIALFAIYSLNQRARENRYLAEQNHIFLELINELTESSRRLTESVRLYVITQDPEHEENFWNIVRQRSGELPRPEESAVAPGVSVSLVHLLQQYAPSQSEYELVRRALLLSERLVAIENQAMDAAKGIIRKDGTVEQGIPDWKLARHLVFNRVYLDWQKEILGPLQESLKQVRERASAYVAAEYTDIIIGTSVFMGILLLILLMVFVFAYQIRKGHLLPLERINSFADEITQGQYDKRYRETKNPELGLLEQTLNLLLDKLQEERNRSNTDALTHLYNRRHYDKKLLDFRRDQEEDKIVFSLLSLDIDFFKRINDTFGHVYGDEVLKSFALVLRECSRADDILARVGGEEFVILAHGDSGQTARLAERIRRAVEEKLLLPNGRPVTCSIGIAQYRNGMELTVLQGNADTALYRAKQGGRNRVCIFGATG